ncbi:MAG TPA: PEP-CTERM sorting domain-containing protein [Patescibacteria group bacterium]|jgi:CRISPR-associated Cas5-like protein|nr:PEP-CTERM sorting domain-containing protein [Patescibacteria group bacterium]
MKTLIPTIGSTLTILALAALPARADIYGDATGENFTAAGGGILDISSVEVTRTATDLIFKINLTGDPVATDWGKYMIGLDTTAGGDPASNGWLRPISMSSGMDYWIGSWTDAGNGAELRAWNGSSWVLQSATYNPNPDSLSVSKDTSSVTLTLKYAGMGLTPTSVFNFDVYTSGGGGGDGAVDALANPVQSIADWGDPYNSELQKTFPVPEPTALTLLGLGGLVIQRIYRRRK